MSSELERNRKRFITRARSICGNNTAMLDLCMEQHDGWMRSDSRADSLGKIVRAQSLDIQRMEKQVKDAEQIRRQCLLFEQDNEKLRIENEKLLKENLEYKEELAREKIEKGDLQSRVDELNSLALEDMRNAAALAALQAEIERLSKANEVNKEDIEKLKGQTVLANKAMFGFTSEKMDMLFRSFPNVDQLSEDADPETGEVAEDDETSDDGSDGSESPNSSDDAGDSADGSEGSENADNDRHNPKNSRSGDFVTALLNQATGNGNGPDGKPKKPKGRPKGSKSKVDRPIDSSTLPSLFVFRECPREELIEKGAEIIKSMGFSATKEIIKLDSPYVNLYTCYETVKWKEGSAEGSDEPVENTEGSEAGEENAAEQEKAVNEADHHRAGRDDWLGKKDASLSLWHFTSADRDPKLYQRSPASRSLLREVLEMRYVMSCPIERIAKYLQRQGIKVTKDTLVKWSINYPRAFCLALRNYFMTVLNGSCKVQNIDESTWRLVVWADETGKLNGSLGYIWVHSTGPFTDPGLPKLNVYFFERTRATDHLRKWLKKYCGYIVSDALGDYPQYEGERNGEVKDCMDWMHARRYMAQAVLVMLPKMKKWTREEILNYPAVRALIMINDIFAEEQEFKDKSAEERHEGRKAKVGPLIIEYFNYLRSFRIDWEGDDELEADIEAGDQSVEDEGQDEGQDHEDDDKKAVLSKAFRKAVGYSLRNEMYLVTFLEDPSIPIDNGKAERCFKIVASARKASLFSYSEKGADVSCAYLTFVTSALDSGENVSLYLDYLLSEMPKYLPRVEKVKDEDGKVIDEVLNMTDEELESLTFWSPQYRKYLRDRKPLTMVDVFSGSNLPQNGKLRFSDDDDGHVMQAFLRYQTERNRIMELLGGAVIYKDGNDAEQRKYG